MSDAVDRAEVRILHVPGGGNSGPDHWHTHWERTDPRCERVVQDDWEAGTRDAWVAGLDRHVRSGDDRPTVLAAHSLGNLAVVHWMGDRTAAGHRLDPVVAAMLVAPVDVERDDLGPGSIYAGFRPLPTAPLPVPSVLVASTEDPWISIDRAAEIASAWGAELFDLGPQQHLGSECQLGTWPVGQQILDRLLERVR